MTLACSSTSGSLPLARPSLVSPRRCPGYRPPLVETASPALASSRRTCVWIDLKSPRSSGLRLRPSRSRTEIGLVLVPNVANWSPRGGALASTGQVSRVQYLTPLLSSHLLRLNGFQTAEHYLLDLAVHIVHKLHARHDQRHHAGENCDNIMLRLEIGSLRTSSPPSVLPCFSIRTWIAAPSIAAPRLTPATLAFSAPNERALCPR